MKMYEKKIDIEGLKIDFAGFIERIMNEVSIDIDDMEVIVDINFILEDLARGLKSKGEKETHNKCVEHREKTDCNCMGLGCLNDDREDDEEDF